MIQIICGTNRPNSRSLQICRLAQAEFSAQALMPTQILNLTEVGLEEINGSQYGSISGVMKEKVDQVTNARGLFFIIPEYNGSYPGVLKYFLDHWIYPDSFENRPVAFVGLGTRFGGLRAVEHMQQVMGYRNAYCFPQRLFVTNVHQNLKDGELQDPLMRSLFKQMIHDFSLFIRGLESMGLDANSRLKKKMEPQL